MHKKFIFFLLFLNEIYKNPYTKLKLTKNFEKYSMRYKFEFLQAIVQNSPTRFASSYTANIYPVKAT